MFNELLKDLKSTVDTMRYGIPTRTITVAKPYCTPCRHIVTGALEPYGVRIYDYREGAKMTNPLTVLKMTGKLPGDVGLTIPNALPIAQVAEVIVSERAAAWAEYLLLRTGKLYRVGGYINKRNEQWAARHGGQMSPAWNEGKPCIETSCREGMLAWQAIKQLERQEQTPFGDRQTVRKHTKR